MTDRQRQTLVAMLTLIGQKGYPPTVQELAEALDISAPSAYENINHLVRKGYVTKVPGKARSLVVIKYPPETQ